MARTYAGVVGLVVILIGVVGLLRARSRCSAS